MASSGPNLPSAAISLANAGTSENANAWTNTANIYGAGTASITAATFDSPDISEILVASGFGFTLPGSTVDGITVVINKRGFTSANSGKDFRVQLATGTTFASLVGDNKATASVWPQTTLTDTTYGGTTDTWNAGLTSAQVNADGFSVFISAYANVANADIEIDSVTVTVEYTTTATEYPVTSADSIATLSDAVARQLGVIRAGADTLSAISEAVTRVVARNRTAADDIAALSEAVSRQLFFGRSSADSIASISEAVAQQLGLARAGSDTLAAITDAVFATLAKNRSAADDLPSLSDAVSRQIIIGRSGADSLSSMVETATRIGSFTRRESRPGD